MVFPSDLAGNIAVELHNPPPPMPPQPPPDEDQPGPNAVACLGALAAAGVTHTPAGVAALALADRFDHSRFDTGSGVAAIYKAYSQALERALAPTAPKQRPVDVVDGIFS